MLLFDGEGERVKIRRSTFAIYVPFVIVWRNESFDMRMFSTLLLKLFSLYLSIFRKSVEEIQDSLKSDKNDGYFTWTYVQL
jgi:hypothetical protein